MLQLRAARRGAHVASRAVRAARFASTQVARPEPSDPQLGEYPDLPRELSGTRNPFGNEQGRWYDIQNRRHFGEPVRLRWRVRERLQLV